MILCDHSRCWLAGTWDSEVLCRGKHQITYLNGKLTPLACNLATAQKEDGYCTWLFYAKAFSVRKGHWDPVKIPNRYDTGQDPEPLRWA